MVANGEEIEAGRSFAHSEADLIDGASAPLSS